MCVCYIFFLNYDFSFFDVNESVYCTVKFRGKEDCIVDNIKLCGDFSVTAAKKACITYRIPVNIFKFNQ